MKKPLAPLFILAGTILTVPYLLALDEGSETDVYGQQPVEEWDGDYTDGEEVNLDQSWDDMDESYDPYRQGSGTLSEGISLEEAADTIDSTSEEDDTSELDEYGNPEASKKKLNSQKRNKTEDIVDDSEYLYDDDLDSYEELPGEYEENEEESFYEDDEAVDEEYD
ncbi:hypothetical protein, partial [Sansalvadorimonas verongulae]|uniref:hypothetical protein n=1 Tax=Sansalvadorimonas verongulae TaxID=2172824 RepID=UPI001E543B51